MHLRDFLAKRERELLEQITGLHDQLTPLEAELAEVRRARAAIGSVQVSSDAAMPVGWQAYTLEGQEQGPLALRASDGARVSAYADLTMKELVIKVLRDHFQKGATTRQMVEFFRDAWHRDIPRANLSPQISRLYQEGIIGRLDATKEWYGDNPHIFSPEAT